MKCIKTFRWKDISIRRKLIAVYFIIIIIPIITLGYYLTNKLSNSFAMHIAQSNSTSVEILEKDVVKFFENYMDIIDGLINDPRLAGYLKTDFESDIEAYEVYKRDIDVLINTAKYKESKLRIKIFTPNKTIISSGYFANDLSYTELNSLNISDIRYMRKINWDGIVNLYDQKYLICHTPIMDRDELNKRLGILFTYIDIGQLTSLTDMSKSSENLIYIVDDKKNIMASNNNAECDTGLESGDTSLIGGKRYLVLSEDISIKSLFINSWKIIYMVPVTSVDSQVRSIWTTTIWIAFVCIILTFIIIRLFSNNISSRIYTLVEGIRAFESGDAKIKLECNQTDEIGQLILITNGMFDKINYLITETLASKIRMQEAEIEKQKLERKNMDAQLLLLQSQINPHYLFNTLECIRMRTLVNGDMRTAKIIRIFADSFREIMYSNDSCATLEHELNFIKDYFVIQKYRFNDRLDYSIKCGPDLESIKIPRFIIQPLVENSILHGVEKLKHKCYIEIDIYGQDGYLCLKVSDNGVGMDGDSLAALITAIKSENNPVSGMALHNIYMRLKIIYKDDLDFDIQSTPGLGTTIYIRFPR